MQLLCDFCENNPARLICCADEAALCLQCDVQVHAANKIASKHERIQFLGLLTDSKNSTPCDICQEKSGYFFCLEDRALLCRNCDFSIHTVNTIVSKHRRFVVMGTRVALHPLQAPTNQSTLDELPLMEAHSGQNLSFHSNAHENTEVHRRVIEGQFNGRNMFHNHQHKEYKNLQASKSSIGKYLTEIIPGWRVDDFLSSPQSSSIISEFSSYRPRSKDCAGVQDEDYNGALAEVPELHSHTNDDYDGGNLHAPINLSVSQHWFT